MALKPTDLSAFLTEQIAHLRPLLERQCNLPRPLGGAREVRRQGGGQGFSGRDRDDGVHKHSVGGLWKSHRRRPFQPVRFYVIHKIMAQSISDRQKKKGRGRPPTGIRPLVCFRLSEEEIARVDAWGERRGLSRSTAIRAMITEALDRTPRRQHK